MSEQGWSQIGVVPNSEGVYEVKHMDDETCFQHWNGKWWGRCSDTAADAAMKAGYKSYFQEVAWRGIASDPSQSKENSK